LFAIDCNTSGKQQSSVSARFAHDFLTSFHHLLPWTGEKGASQSSSMADMSEASFDMANMDFTVVFVLVSLGEKEVDCAGALVTCMELANVGRQDIGNKW
jgi:hypothetical protein